MASITSANATLLLSVPPLFSVPQQIQGFAVDDIYDVDATAVAETQMGVDGNLSGGYVYTEKKQKIHLQSDSASNAFFEAWKAGMDQIIDVYIAQGTIILNSVNRKYAMVNGFLTMYSNIPDAGKLLKPRVYEITWAKVLPAPTAANAF